MNLGRFIRTVRYLRPYQIFYRLWWPLRRVRPGTVTTAVAVEPAARAVETIAKPAVVETEHRLRLLNQTIEISDAASWNAPDRDKLLLYHLHYHEVLNGEQPFAGAEEAAHFIDKWIDDNPPIAGNGWEPYPISLRIVNWIKWVWAGNSLSSKQLRSLQLQARVLSQSIEYHVQANHLLANATGLFFAGAFLGGQEAQRWLAKGHKLLEAAVEEQILDDGGHYERSPMYQATVLENFLDVLNICRAYGLSPPNGMPEAASAMLRWLALMTHPDGLPAYFNDTTLRVAPTLAALRSYAERLGIPSDIEEPVGLTHMSASGYLRYSQGRLAAIIDVGEIGPDFQPGHAHCDCLSFELSIDDRRLFVNTGVSTYNANERRHLERATASHNTVSVPGQEQSEIWGAFRVGRRARPHDVAIGERHVAAAHDGYRGQGVIHRRRFEFADDHVRIMDTLEADHDVTGTAHFHCHPDFDPQIDGNSIVVGPVRLEVGNARKVEILPYEYCDGFNKRRPARKIIASFGSELTTHIYL